MQFRSVLCFVRIITCLSLALPLVAGWQALGPFGGAVQVVQVDPHHPGTILAATSNGLLFRSENDGVSWQPIPFPAQMRCVLRTFLIDPQVPDTYLAGISGDTPELSGLLRTTDAGKTWQVLPGLKGMEVWSTAYWPGDSKVLAAGTAHGVYLTRDGGESWRPVSDPANHEMDVIVSLAFDPRDDNTLFAGTPHLPWKTTNGGVLWLPVHNGILDDSDVFSLHVDRAHPQRMFASACSGIYASLNAGALWHKLSGARGASYRTYFVSLDPRESDTVFAGTTHGLVKSTDGGLTWRQLSTHLSRYVAFDPHHSHRIYVATDDDGIERSDDEGDTLLAMNNGFCNRQLPALTVAGDSLFTNTIYERNGGIFRLPGDQESWQKVTPASGFDGRPLLKLVPDGANASRWYGEAFSSLVVSADSGHNWNALAPTLPKSRVVDLFSAANGSFLLAATEAGIYRSGDAGKIWKRVTLPTTSQNVRAFFPLENGRVAAATRDSVLFSKDGMLWFELSPLPDHAEPYAVLESGSLFAATSSGLVRSGDDGHSWQVVTGGLPRSTVQAICKHPTQPGVLVAAQYSEVYESLDNGNSWAKISPDEPRVTIRELAIVPEKSNRLFVLTPRQGVFALPLEATAPGASN